jgi:beta-lactamase class A
MRRRAVRSPLLAFMLFFGACSSAAPPVPAPAPVPVPAPGIRAPQAFASDLAPLESAIRQRLAGEPGEYGIAVIDIETGRFAGVNDRLVLHAASTMKVPLLLELYRRAGYHGEPGLDDTITVRNRFRSIADTSHFYSLSPDDDSERGLYDMVGRTATLRDLARRMIVRSSNLATNLLIDELGHSNVHHTVLNVGGDGMRVLRGVEDGPAFRAGMNNTTTARGFAHVLAAIARCDILSRVQCDEVIDILAAHEFNELIPAGLPAGTRIAHKTGWITGIQHDGAIVLPANSPPFVLVVLSRGAADTLAVRRAAADIARLTWDALGPRGTLRPRWHPATAELLRLHDEVRLPGFSDPRLLYDPVWNALLPIMDRSPLLTAEEVGRSASGQRLRLVRFGEGPTRVLLWSQMHGDETTATRALADLINFIAARPDDARIANWRRHLTIAALPMLNPDGAAAPQRRGVHGIDINRDARALATPEGRALKGVQQSFQPHFGFNLHDQNPRSRVGSAPRTAAMSLLAPPPDAAATSTPSFERAVRLTAHIAGALAPLVGHHLTRYDDSWNPRAFGDNMQAWGVSTVLIETGSWQGDDSKHYLRRANFLALVAALDALADGSFQNAEPALYTTLPENGRAMHDVIIRGGSIVMNGWAYRADIAIDAAAVGGPASTQVVDVGDLADAVGRDVLDAEGLFIHPSFETPHPGRLADFTLRRSADPASEAIWTVEGTVLRQLTARR